MFQSWKKQANLLMNNVSGWEQNVLARSCKDCVHYDVCYELTYHEPNGEIVGREVCNNFKDKSRFVELPCKVGDWLYLPCCGEIIKLQVFEININHIFVDYGKGVIRNIIALNDKGGRMEFKFSDIGKTVFLTREEAEKALKERKSNSENF